MFWLKKITLACLERCHSLLQAEIVLPGRLACGSLLFSRKLRAILFLQNIDGTLIQMTDMTKNQ